MSLGKVKSVSQGPVDYMFVNIFSPMTGNEKIVVL